MADTKITALAAISTIDVNPATSPIPIVDLLDNSMAASGTTKKVTVNQILGAGGTATLASATITGDLTVDTSTLKVDSANNRVGVVQATPLYPLHLVGEFGLEEASPAGTGSKLRFIGDATKYNFRIGKQLNVSNGFEITPSTTVGGTTFSNPVYTVTNDGIHTFLDGAGGTRMTLNSTGLGVGGSPVSGMLLTVGSTSSVSATANAFQILSNKGTFNVVTDGSTNAAGTTITYSWANGGQGPLIFRNAAISNVMTLGASGNVGIGVTPSALTNVTRLEIGGQLSSNVTLRSTSTSSSARNWMVGANMNSFGDFVIRQGNSQGAEPNSGTDRLVIDLDGNPIFTPSSTPATLTTNGQLTVNATSNTNLRFSYRGSDGVTRVANITLA